MAFSLSALVLAALGYWGDAQVVLGLLAVAAFLESALGLCLGCKVFARPHAGRHGASGGVRALQQHLGEGTRAGVMSAKDGAQLSRRAGNRLMLHQTLSRIASFALVYEPKLTVPEPER